MYDCSKFVVILNVCLLAKRLLYFCEDSLKKYCMYHCTLLYFKMLVY